jgi:uroporphyrin-III C-methyltransferase/precorrin-2 dehydrogenase/sirohydrochlorin ferrochelatase
MQPSEPRLYPAFLKLAGLPVVVVGGGVVAASKLDGLVEAGARVTVVAPAVCDAIRARAQGSSIPRHPLALALALAPGSPAEPPGSGSAAVGPSIALIERGFVAGDLDGARWVVAAATPEVNRAVAAAAAARGLFVNAVDDVASASAYLGAVVQRGPVLLAISTGGLAPALAGLLREALEAVLPDDLARWIDVAKLARTDWKRAGTPIGERRPLLLRALDRIYSSRSETSSAASSDTRSAASSDARVTTSSDARGGAGARGRVSDDAHPELRAGAS